MSLDPIKLSQDLIRCPSVTGDDAGITDLLANILSKIGFKTTVLDFTSNDSYPVKNLHAIYNPKHSNNVLYFAGHTDVVKPGDSQAWKFPPFLATIENGILYGRGAVDMKCAIASFICSANQFIHENQDCHFGIGLLITGDEEADAINGTKKMLDWLKENNQPISACIVGEPTNPNRVGEMIKIGRRGSISFDLKIIGKQGHVAYPENANNPITTLVNVLKILKDYRLDDGDNFFTPSNLEITNITSPNLGGNVIVPEASANFNIRFNHFHTSESILAWVKYVCDHSSLKYQLNHKISGESFLTKSSSLSNLLAQAVKTKTGLDAELSTTGGTSDARFIKDFCPVVEFGLVNKTAHQIDEMTPTKDIKILTDIYKETLILYQSQK